MLKKVALLFVSCAVFGAACGASENTVSREPKTKNAALGVDASARITITATRAGSPTVSCSYAVGAATSCVLPKLEGRGWSIGASLSATVGAESVQVLGGGQTAVVAPTSTTNGPATTVVAPGTLCDDGNAATTGDVIIRGVCRGAGILNCDDNNPLTYDAADTAVGCVYTPVADGTPCDDGDPSTSPDGAINGRCAPGTTSTTKPLPPTTIPATTTTIPPTTTTTINYSGQNLRGRNFAGAQLINANLSGANLSGAVLTGANLTGANLTGANLGGANLSNAILSRANVMRTNFTGATVRGGVSGALRE
ncbi:MAG: pentapeptide repeat-containing protein, partial [Actinomycetota bacterium]